jgi:hypothetical protein
MRSRIRAVPLGALAVALSCASGVQARQRALLIGVADVPNYELPGIDLDIDNMKKVAAIMGFAPDDIKVLFNQEATRANVLHVLDTWAREGVGPNDRVLIYFSGHGSRIPDSGSPQGVDDVLVTHDMRRAVIEGKASLSGVILGREFGVALSKIPSHEVLVLVDACHSGTATRDIDLGSHHLGTAAATSKFFAYPGMPEAPAATRDVVVSHSHENYAALSAALDTETAAATLQGGLFTLALADAIQNAARDKKHPNLNELRDVTDQYIATHTRESPRQHPAVDGNERLISGDLALIPLQNGQGPTWQSLAALAAKGEPLTLAGEARQIHVGEEVTLDVALPRDGFLNVVTVDSQDRATVLFPNKFTSRNEVKAGHFTFPTKDMNFLVRAAEPLGPSLVVAFLTDKPVNLLELGVEGRDAAGRMAQVFTEVSARATRALVVEAKESRFASGTLNVNVQAKTAH